VGYKIDVAETVDAALNEGFVVFCVVEFWVEKLHAADIVHCCSCSLQLILQ